MRDYVRLKTFGKQWGVTVSCNVAMLILSGVSGQQDLFVQNNETVSTSGLPGAETYLMISGSSESMENMLQIEEQVWEPIGIFSMVCVKFEL